MGLNLISIRDLIAYRLKQESLVEKGVEVDMPLNTAISVRYLSARKQWFRTYRYYKR